MNSLLLSHFLEAAARALLLALLVGAGLGLLRVRNVMAQKAAWCLVLAAAFVMPFLPRWHGVTIPAIRLQGLQAVQRAMAPAAVSESSADSESSAKVENLPEAPASSAQVRRTARQERSAAAAPKNALENQLPGVDAADRYPAPVISQEAFGLSDGARAETAPAPPSLLHRMRQAVAHPIALAWTAYLGMCAFLLARLGAGVGVAARLWWSARPVDSLPQFELPAEMRLRCSPRVASPVALGSGILLPENYAEWDVEKLRVVLAHERAHVRQGDFYLQLLARLYAALFWLSPLGWWLKRKLSDLGEAISDHAGLEAAASRTSYAEVLLEFAAMPRPNLIGVPMAHSSNLSQRIERFLNEAMFRSAFSSTKRRTLAAVLLVPAALLAATAMVRVEAASSAQQSTSSSSQIITAPVAPVAPVVPVAQVAPIAPVRPIAPVAPVAPVVTTVAVQAAVPSIVLEPVAPVAPGIPSVAALPRNLVVPVAPIAPVAPVVAIAPVVEIASLSSVARMSIRSRVLAMMRGGDSDGYEATFDRTLTAGAQLELLVSTGSGNIHIVQGTGNSVHIHGTVRAGHDGSEEQVRAVVASPPIEQTGDIIRIGGHQENMQHISISYEIEAPAGAMLTASTGSGDIKDEGVGQQAKLTTGSGNIHATGLRAGFTATTGSGDVYIEESGEGDVKASTGSGNIELKGPAGGLHATTGSGDLKITGTPTADWKLGTGSGNIELWIGNAPVTLDASFGSGSLHSDREMLTQGSSDRHHIVGKIGEGGPTIRMETGSGDIRVH